MSAVVKLQLSRLAIIATVTVLAFTVFSGVALAQSMGDVRETAEAVASMNAMQLLAYIAIASIAALVIVVGFYVKSVSAFQKEIAASLATITTALNDLAKNCKACR